MNGIEKKPIYLFITMNLSVYLFLTVLTQIYNVRSETTSTNTRIENGTISQPNEFPFAIAIKSSNKFCVGSLIRADVVLTSAQCVADSTSYTLYAGVHNMNNIRPTAQIRRSKQIIIHKEWQGGNVYDIALVVTKQPFRLNSNRVKVIPRSCLYNIDNELATTVGWWNKNSLGQIRKGKGMILDEQLCADACGTHLANNSVLCLDSSSTGQYPVLQDAGSPLFFLIGDEELRQVGISSYVEDPNCALGNYSIFTRTSYYCYWIEDRLNEIYS